jgi:hypothetical protein
MWVMTDLENSTDGAVVIQQNELHITTFISGQI